MPYDKEKTKLLKKQKNYEELFAYLSEFAKSEIPEALNELAECYYWGLGTEKDYTKSFYYDNIAANLGNADSIAVLGFDYEHGVGVVTDQNKAISLYQQAVSLGSTRGMTYLGQCFENGTGVNKDCEMAVTLYRQAAEQGYARAQRILGLCYEKGTGVPEDKCKAVYWYKKSAEQDNKVAQRWLAMCYEYGDGVGVDISQAIEWYLKAVGNDDDISRVRLACIYYDNFEDEEKDRIALDCLQTAVNNLPKDSYHYYLACNRIARYYENGYMVERDPKRAFEYDMNAASGGIKGSIIAVAYYYKDGIGTTENNTEAINWLERGIESMEDSVDKGNHHLVLAELYNIDYLETYDPDKRDSHYSKAFNCLKKAIEKDHHNAEAELELAKLYYKGNGVELNYPRAFSIFKKLSEHSEESIKIPAEYNLAKCYFLGRGVSENLTKGFQLIKSLGKEGHVFSVIYEIYCYLYGIGVRKNRFKAKKLLRRLEKYSVENNNEYCEEINFYKGIIQYHGLGTPKNTKKAKEFFKFSTALGRILYLPICDGDYGKANLLGTIYYSNSLAFGYMLFGNKKISKELLTLASDNGFISGTGAKYLFHIITDRRILTARTRKQAFDIIVNKSSDVHDDAKILLTRGQCFYYGFGTKKDYSSAFYYFEKSADLGDDIAKIYVSICYANGYGTQRDIEKARRVLDEASVCGGERSMLLKGLLMYVGEWGYKRSKEASLEQLKVNEKYHVFYDVLSTMRGDLYINVFIEMYLTCLRLTFDSSLTTIRTLLIPIIKLLFLLAFKHPLSSNLSKKEMLRIILELGNNQVAEQKYIRNTLGYIKEDTSKIIDQQKETIELIHSIIDSVEEQKRNLPNENSLRFLDETQVEQMQSRFIEETAAKIIDSLQEKSVSVEKEEALLKGMFGEHWLKLDAYTRKALVSARVLFNQCRGPEFASLDHSGIVVSATSALENELKRRLFTGFQAFMKNKLGTANYAEWPELLVFRSKKGELLLNKSFPLGSLPYLFEGSDKDKKYLSEYLNSILSEQYADKGVLAFTTIKTGGDTFLNKCEKIRVSFRNAAAHTGLVDRTKAEACCNAIIGPNEASKKIGQVQGLLYDLVQMTENYQ